MKFLDNKPNLKEEFHNEKNEALDPFEIAKKEISGFMMKNERIPKTGENLGIRNIYQSLGSETNQKHGSIENWPHLLTECIKNLKDNKLKRKLTNEYQKLLYINHKREWHDYGLEFDTHYQLNYKRPDLVDELHPTLNSNSSLGIIHYTANTPLWWVCKFKHNFYMRLSERTLENQNCPICSYQDMAMNPESKPKYFWLTLYPAFYYAKKVMTDFFVANNRVPASQENKNIHTIYRALRNPKVQKIWNVENWAELLRMIIGEFDDTMGDLRDKLIDSYNIMATKLKHQGWIEIIV